MSAFGNAYILFFISMRGGAGNSMVFFFALSSGSGRVFPLASYGAAENFPTLGYEYGARRSSGGFAGPFGVGISFGIAGADATTPFPVNPGTPPIDALLLVWLLLRFKLRAFMAGL